MVMSVSQPIVLHLVRPYGGEEEYLAAEGWTIEARGMLLIDAAPLPADTAVLFDVTLEGGQKPIRAEGRVIGSVAAQGGVPGGVRVRFKRFGAATKAFIDRAVSRNAVAARPPEPPPPPEENSGVRRRAPSPVSAPPNRDELLARLRQRRVSG
jgi:hypothetical protein